MAAPHTYKRQGQLPGNQEGNGVQETKGNIRHSLAYTVPPPQHITLGLPSAGNLPVTLHHAGPDATVYEKGRCSPHAARPPPRLLPAADSALAAPPGWHRSGPLPGRRLRPAHVGGRLSAFRRRLARAAAA